MVYSLFDGQAIKNGYECSSVEVIRATRSDYGDLNTFLEAAITYLDEKIYPGCGISSEYEELELKDGEYRSIVEHWLSILSQPVDIELETIKQIKRLKKIVSDPINEEFVIETNLEYILLSWSTAE